MEHITVSSHDLACLIPGDIRTLLLGRASTLRRAKGPTLAPGNWVILFFGGEDHLPPSSPSQGFGGPSTDASPVC